MNRTLAGAVAVLMMLLGGTLAACGDDANEFKEDYNQAVKPLSELNSRIGNSIGSAAEKSNEAIAKEFNMLASRAQKTRDNLAQLEPPEDAKQEFDKLLAALQKGTDDLRAVAKAAKDGDPEAAAKASRDLVKSGTEIQSAEQSLQSAVDG